jgi:hypothetical protein
MSPFMLLPPFISGILLLNTEQPLQMKIWLTRCPFGFLASYRLCPLLNGTMKPEDAGINGDSSFGAVPAPLTL